MIAPARLQRAWLALLLIVPLVLVALSYAWLAVEHGTPWLWNVVVHEGGEYTLGGTVLYVRHFLREIPVDVAMALSLAAAIRMAVDEPPAVRRQWFVAGAIVLAVVAFAMAAAEEGRREAFRDLLQFRTRDDDVSYGSHWHFHLLSTIWFCTAAPLLAGITVGAQGLTAPGSESRRLLTAAWMWFGALTLAFGPGLDTFTSQRYIGHQAREILTHGLITLPLVFACGVLAGRVRTPRMEFRATVPRVLAWVTVIGIPVFLAIAFSRSTLESSAQLESGVAGVVAAHVFEHALDFVLVLVMTLALVAEGRAGAGQPVPGGRRA